LEGLSGCLQRNRGVTVMFDDVLKGAKARSSSEQRELARKANKVDEAKSSPPAVAILENETVNTPKKRKSGGKRTDPTYKQVGAYIKKDTYLQIQRLLLEQPDKDFSDLVQELLSDYLDNQLTD
jgi:hypothetical protein